MLAALRPDDPNGLNLLTTTYAACGDFDTAIQHAERWATVAPDPADPVQMLNHLRDLKAVQDQHKTAAVTSPDQPPDASGT